MPPATAIAFRDGAARASRYWSADHYPLLEAELDQRAEHRCHETFRELFTHAVRTAMLDSGRTWAQLSGGLDSSSVVSVAEHDAQRSPGRSGLGGTVTVVDRQRTAGDERTYSNAVVDTYGVRNDLLVDYENWEDDGQPPPRTDSPHDQYYAYARDRAMANIARAAGADAMLTGVGSDHYLTGTMFFFVDRIVRGDVRRSLREMLEWAIIGEVSFWELALKNVVMPLLPAPLLRATSPDARLPEWMPARVVSALALRGRQGTVAAYGGPLGHKYAHALTRTAHGISRGVDHWVLEDLIELRYPFLYRPLVEFSLTLPVGLRTRPGARKWVLRQALAGILPDVIRTRRGKGSPETRMARSLLTNRGIVDRLVEEPVLGQLGCIDPPAFARAVERARRGDRHLRSRVLSTLALETWLRVRSGRWSATAPQDTPVAERRREAPSRAANAPTTGDLT